MKISIISAILFTHAALISMPASATGNITISRLCSELTSRGAGTVTAVGAFAATAKSSAAAVGVAAVEHSSGSLLLSSVGAGGTGYIAGSLGSAGAAALGFASSPLVIGTAAAVAIGTGGAYAYCQYGRYVINPLTKLR